MKTNHIRLVAVSVLALAVFAPSSFAQRQLGKKKGPTGKVYVAQAIGDTQIQNDDKIYTARQATAFDAPGTIIVTKAGASNALVFSNGTGVFIDENSRVEINRFDQERFTPERNKPVDSAYEPAISHSRIMITQGGVGICPGKLAAGSSMNYSTPFADITVRSGKLSVEATPGATFVDLLDGDITVRGSGGRDVGGQLLRPGERATIIPSPTGGQPTVSIGPIPATSLQLADTRVGAACNAKKSVTFEVIERKAEAGLDQPATPEVAAGDAATPPAADAAADAAGAEEDAAGTDQEIVAKPTVPQNPPTNIVVSPDRLPGT